MPLEHGSSSSSIVVVARPKRPQPVPRPGRISFPCCDCSLTFSTHQALGGHRKFHTRLLDPAHRKRPRPQPRPRRETSPVIAAEGARATPNPAPKAEEINYQKEAAADAEEEWHAVDVVFPEHSGAAPVKVEVQVEMELDLTLHL